MVQFAANTIETPDVASIQAGERHYRCYVWAAAPEGSGFSSNVKQTIESAIVIVLPNGDEQEVFRGQVRTPATGICDSPKVIAFTDALTGGNPIFVCHWLEGARADPPALHRASLRPDAAGWLWTHGGSTPTSSAWLYDVVSTGYAAEVYYIVHRESGTAFTTTRYGTVFLTWAAGFTWSVSNTVDSHFTLLCIHADDGADDVVAWAWERDPAGAAPRTIYCRRVDGTTGANGVTWQAMTGLDPSSFVCGGWDRRQAQQWMLVVEAALLGGEPADDTVAPYVAWQTQIVSSASAAESGGVGRCYWLRLLSRPWARANGVTTGTPRNVHAICAFSEKYQSDYGQSAAFVVELPRGSSDFAERALPSGNLNLRLPDARNAGAHPNSSITIEPDANGRRLNHVSSVSRPPTTGQAAGYTSEKNAYTVALCIYPKFVTQPNSFIGTQPDVPLHFVPHQTSVIGYSVHAEEPWMRHRDAIDGAAPALSFKGTYAWHQYQPVHVADMLAIAGGLPQIYDGRRAVEIGWTWNPEIFEFNFTGFVGAGIGLDVGEYQFTAIYEWTDAAGHVHRSAPATPVMVDSAPTPPETAAYTVEIICNTLSRRFDTFATDITHANVVLYRADPGATVFRRVFNASGTFPLPADHMIHTPWNDPDAATVLMSAGPTDISSREILPWTLSNGAWVPLVPKMPPAASVGFVWQDRLFLVPSEEPNTLWYSLRIQPGPGSQVIAAPEFSSINVYRCDAEALVITGGVGMDEHAIIFGEDGIYALSGEPNDDTGNGATLSLQLMHRNVGCIDQRSIVRTSEGVFFQSDKGIQLLDRGFVLDNVSTGSAVEDDVALSGNLRGATLLEGKKQVIFIGNSAPSGGPIALVYDYHHKIWTKRTLPLGDQTNVLDGDSWLSAAADGIAWRGAVGETLHCVLQQGALLVEREQSDADLYRDQIRSGIGSINSNAYNRIDIQTGWISLAGVAGYKRVWEVGILTSGQAAATDPALSLTVDYDISGSYSGSVTHTVTHEADYVAYVRYKTRYQKVSAIRLRMQDGGSFTTIPEWSVSSATLRVGVKKGLRKVGSSQLAT